jgi:succinate dehydrogenase/fumarate reductase flavoprotein subunit
MMIVDKANWYDGADVVVVGYGAAGAVAAITAHDKGANVLILEKQPSENHISNSHLAGGSFISPSDVAGFKEYLTRLCSTHDGMLWTDLETIKVWSEYTCQNHQWVQQMGGKITSTISKYGSHREIPGNDLLQKYFFDEHGQGLMNFLNNLVRQRKIHVMYGIGAKKLITNHRNEVIGVVAQKDGKAEINIKAAKAVILANGGFEFNETMKLQFLRCDPFYFIGSQANTGDGIKMAMGVGAELWHMNCCSGGFTIKLPDMPCGFTVALRGASHPNTETTSLIDSYSEAPAVCGYAIVDKLGRRYTNENFKIHHVNYELNVYDSQKLSFPRIPSYWIMDQKRIADGSLSMTNSGWSVRRHLYQWSNDNSKEIEIGWIKRAENVRELAQKIGIESDNLVQTLKNYNSYCRNGNDPDFQRRPQSLIPLDNPPYYAIEVWPGGPNTQGGPRRNYKSQIINVEGEPIQGLYGAGELGSVFGMLYTGGGNIAECISFGRIAGERAAEEKSRLIV